MSSCRLRGITPYGQVYYFVPGDIPVRVYEDRFILARNPEVPAMLVNTVCRVMDHMDVGEGDVVEIDGTNYTVSYVKGFILTSESGVIIPSNRIETCGIISVCDTPCTKLQFRAGGVTFRIQAFLGCYGNKAVISHVPKLCDIDEIRIGAGFVYQKQKVFYGDTVEGYEVVMWHGRPCLATEQGYVELPTKQLLKGA